MASIIKERYTLLDAWNRQEPREYAGIIIRAAKSAELGSVGHIIMLIYNGLDLEFQRDLTMPTLTTPLEQFLQEINDHKDIWWGLTSQTARLGRLSSNPYYQGYSRGLRNPYQTSTNYNRGQSRFNSYVSPAQERDNLYQSFTKNYAQRQQKDDSNPEQSIARQIKPPKPKLMITAGPANGFDSTARQPYPTNTPKAGNLFRASDSRPRQGQWNNRATRNRNWR